MFIDYLTAGAIATGASIKAFKHPHLAYWWKWDRVPLLGALALILLIYVATGVAVTALALHLGWMVLETGAARNVANGAAYGAAAVLLLRLEITSFGLAPISPARLIFRGVLDRLEGALNAGCARAIPRAIGDLTARQLCRLSWQLFRKYVEPGISEPAVRIADAAELRSRHRRAMKRLGDDAEDDDVIEAQEDLRFTCEDLIVKNLEATVVFPPHDVPN
jgi:hypothetical protein